METLTDRNLVNQIYHTLNISQDDPRAQIIVGEKWVTFKWAYQPNECAEFKFKTFRAEKKFGIAHATYLLAFDFNTWLKK